MDEGVEGVGFFLHRILSSLALRETQPPNGNQSDFFAPPPLAFFLWDGDGGVGDEGCFSLSSLSLCS